MQDGSMLRLSEPYYAGKWTADKHAHMLGISTPSGSVSE
jgi:hypothetical protein